jgi:hypothetical protein
MNNSVTKRRKLVAWTVMFTLTLASMATPAGRNLAVSALVEFAEITEEVVRFPCWLVDHSMRFNLDRLNPTCPQCL